MKKLRTNSRRKKEDKIEAKIWLQILINLFFDRY
jgi:hypothetical protein